MDKGNSVEQSAFCWRF